MAKSGEPAVEGDALGEFYIGGNPPGDLVSGTGGDISTDIGGSGGSGLGGGSGDSGDGRTDPRTAFGGGDIDGADDDDRWIRDDAGNILLSPTGRKRRRRRGSEPRPTSVKEKATKLSVSSVEAILLSSHQMLSVVTGLKSADIGKAKADMLATGIVNVARHYPNSAIDPKLVDWFNLFMAVGICYQPVAKEIRDNVRASRADRRGSGSTNGTGVAVATGADNFANTSKPEHQPGVADPFEPIDFTTLKPAAPIQ